MAPFIGLPIENTGASVSTFQVKDGEASSFKTASVDLNVTVCCPSTTTNSTPDEHGLGSSVSSLHFVVTSLLPIVAGRMLSLVSKANDSVLDEVKTLTPLTTGFELPSVAPVMVVRGAVVSTFQVKDGGEISTFPTLSVDSNVTVC